MKLSIYQKIGFAALGLVAITLFTIFLSKKATELRKKREQNNPSRKERLHDEINEDDTFQEGLAGLSAIQSFFSAIPNDLNNLGSSITSFVGQVGNTILGPIEQIIQDITTVFEGIPNLRNGISNHVTCGVSEAKAGADYGINIFKIIVECMWDKQIKFWNGTCTRYYIIDVIFGIFYGVFIELPLLLIYAITGLDLQFLVNLIIEVVILPIDTIIFALSGFHITEWPESVIENCYRCKGTMDFGDGNGSQIVYKTMGQWGSMLNCTTHEFIHGIVKIFTAVVPSAKWAAWFDGNHLNGGDDNPNVFGL